ncbi:MAG: D-alanyl-D-alanine carboxypeptidase [Ruminococcaceae bacterium]|nr:D-alanyl-D-alanine carboxypeptidase [Oscillospiraceae bacterium]
MEIQTEEQRQEYARRRARRRRMYRVRQRSIELAVLLGIVAGVVVPIWLFSGNTVAPSSGPAPLASTAAPTPAPVYPAVTADTYTLTDEVDANHAILVDVTDHTVVASKSPDTVCFPASVSKVMTLLVAVENITDFTDTFTMTYHITNPLHEAEATVAGFISGEVIVLEDLLYGVILPSGADACQALAVYVSGSEEAFVQKMNDRAKQMGLKNTHFANTSGLHDPQHYTTCEDMVIILNEAMKNPHCRQVLSTYQYTTAATTQHPEGLLLTSTMFSRMRGDEPDGALVIAGKTGYTSQARHTMVSYAQGENGHDYILVTMDGSNRWKATYDAIDTYTMFCSSAGTTGTASTTTP